MSWYTDETSSSTEYEVEPSLGFCKIQHPEKPIVIPRVVTEAFLALQEARKKARIVLPPEPDIWPPTAEELLKEKQEHQAFDIVKESHKLVRQLEALELPEALREQLAKFASLVAECVPFPQEVEEEEQENEKHEEEEESESSVEPEPFERTIRITFADYAPPGWETVGERESAMSIMGPRKSSLQKRGSSVTQDVLASETLVRGSLIEGSMMVASEGEGKLVGGELHEEEIAEPPFDANLVRGSLQRGSLRKGSGVRESLLDGELAGSEVRCT